MLTSLHIENIAVIKSLDVDFTTGFTVFTGETGAGKSIIINSINLLLGDKPQRDMIRSGEETAFVSALFSQLSEDKIRIINESGVDTPDGELYITREISTTGKSSFKLNGRTYPAYVMKQLAPHLVTIHGQHSSWLMTKPENYLGYLDAYSENDREKHRYRDAYARLREAQSRIKELTRDEAEKKLLISGLKQQIAEIDAAKLKPGEEDALLQRRSRIKNAEQLAKGVRTVYRALYRSEKYPSALEQIDRAINAMTALAELTGDVQTAENAKKLNDYRYEIEDIAMTARALTADIDENPTAALDKIETRLHTISLLKRKYGEDEGEIAAHRDKLASRLSQLEVSDITLKELVLQHKALAQECTAAARELSRTREEASLLFSKSIKNELSDLDMNKVEFVIKLTKADTLTADGCDVCEFLISANSGEEPKAISKIASGGELSRIMLALRSVFREKDGVDTMIYDEIDAGISGGTCEKIGVKLKRAAQGCQVLAITHSAQIACCADCHMLIYKNEHDGRTEAKIKALSADERVGETARIMGGVEITDNVLRAAREMIERKY